MNPIELLNLSLGDFNVVVAIYQADMEDQAIQRAKVQAEAERTAARRAR